MINCAAHFRSNKFTKTHIKNNCYRFHNRRFASQEKAKTYNQLKSTYFTNRSQNTSIDDTTGDKNNKFRNPIDESHIYGEDQNNLNLNELFEANRDINNEELTMGCVESPSPYESAYPTPKTMDMSENLNTANTAKLLKITTNTNQIVQKIYNNNQNNKVYEFKSPDHKLSHVDTLSEFLLEADKNNDISNIEEPPSTPEGNNCCRAFEYMKNKIKEQFLNLEHRMRELKQSNTVEIKEFSMNALKLTRESSLCEIDKLGSIINYNINKTETSLMKAKTDNISIPSKFKPNYNTTNKISLNFCPIDYYKEMIYNFPEFMTQIKNLSEIQLVEYFKYMKSKTDNLNKSIFNYELLAEEKKEELSQFRELKRSNPELFGNIRVTNHPIIYKNSIENVGELNLSWGMENRNIYKGNLKGEGEYMNNVLRLEDLEEKDEENEKYIYGEGNLRQLNKNIKSNLKYVKRDTTPNKILIENHEMDLKEGLNQSFGN